MHAFASIGARTAKEDFDPVTQNKIGSEVKKKEREMVKRPNARVCRNCNNLLPGKAVICPWCGAKNKKPFYQQTWFIVLVVLVVIAGMGNINNVNNDKERAEQNSIQVGGKEGAEEETLSTPVIDLDFDTSNCIKMDARLLFEYGCYMKNEKVVTVITIADIDSGALKANTENNDGFFFSIICEFEDKDYPKQFEENDKVTVVGTVTDDSTSIGDTITLKDCSVIGFGEIEHEIAEDIQNQRQLAEALKDTYEKAEADAAQAEKDNYISQCETVKYSDVERNPDNYEGKMIKIAGKVIQVSEGWFNSVTMRISSNGNIWYATYVRADGESRILEGDNITCYGECDGVTSYTTVLGSQVTIPSIKVKYYN